MSPPEVVSTEVPFEGKIWNIRRDEFLYNGEKITREYVDHTGAVAVLALDDIRGTGKTVTVICPIVRRMIDHYPQCLDLVDKAHPGVTFKNPG